MTNQGLISISCLVGKQFEQHTQINWSFTKEKLCKQCCYDTSSEINLQNSIKKSKKSDLFVALLRLTNKITKNYYVPFKLMNV
ncbi:hypothetical protein BpHYR1_004345 [Brachionus plicatilis]|uniref:Uncharacterized protein n=1 Tax=Brachionus plicatilis TaxID=10195 RepID=A0A3M7RFG3_BRAPC|nr:hypothetical protein BpHYR1_004345 [Brachionus plicatilis]